MEAMVITALIGLLLLAVGQLATEPQTLVARPNLVPWPKKVAMRTGSFSFPEKLAIKVTGKETEAVNRLAATLAEDLREVGFAAAAATRNKRVSGPKIVLSLSLEKSLGSEGYRIGVARDISITAPTENGLFYGTRTLLQLLAKGPGQPVSEMMILDKPEFGFRSVLVDVARQFHSIEFHQQMVKRLAQYKINVYHIHFCDDQSYTLPSKAFPSIRETGKHYTEQQLRDLVELAAQYHVTIVPEIDMPGHASALCARIPDLVCRNRQGGCMICGGSDRAYRILTTLIDEAMDIFPGPYMHIGADECEVNEWDECPDCQATKTREGLKDSNALYTWFINRMNSYVKSRGRKTIIWEGFKVGQKPVVDKDILIQEYAVYFEMPGNLIKAGYDLVNTACVPLYIVEHWEVKASPADILAEWNALYFGGDRPPKRLDEMIRVRPSSRLKGVGFCSWENAESSEEPSMFGTGAPADGYVSAPRVPIVAERAWTGSATTAADLLMRAGVTTE